MSKAFSLPAVSRVRPQCVAQTTGGFILFWSVAATEAMARGGIAIVGLRLPVATAGYTDRGLARRKDPARTDEPAKEKKK